MRGTFGEFDEAMKAVNKAQVGAKAAEKNAAKAKGEGEREKDLRLQRQMQNENDFKAIEDGALQVMQASQAEKQEKEKIGAEEAQS